MHKKGTGNGNRGVKEPSNVSRKGGAELIPPARVRGCGKSRRKRRIKTGCTGPRRNAGETEGLEKGRPSATGEVLVGPSFKTEEGGRLESEMRFI